MNRKSLAIAVLVATAAISVNAQKKENPWASTKIKHVLLISVDGMHAVDLENCSKGVASINNGAPYCPNIASLVSTGVHYTAASTSKPSDSFPGLMSIVTGATPRTMGVYYDVSYDRSLDGPAVQTGNGNGPGTCTPGAAPTGFTTEYEEGIDINQNLVNGGALGAGLTDGGLRSIDPQKLDRDPSRGCAPVYPWQFIRTNSIFGVIHDAGGYTAWSDKHPAYSSVAGHEGPRVLDDFYAPEINSLVVPLPGVTTPTGYNCANPDQYNLAAWTNSFQNIQCYDQLKVNAVLNWINGKNHDGGAAPQVPTIFGMNFQALSVGQKYIEKTAPQSGYLDAAGTPAPSLLGEFTFVDDSIGAMVNQIKSNGLWDSTLIIITAKHGQNPIDPTRWNPILNATNGTSPATLLSNAGYIPNSESTNNATGIGPTEDDVSILWLNDPSDTPASVAFLEQAGGDIGLGQIFYGPALSINYNVPGLPPYGDPRSPDIIVSPNVGVDYTGSKSKHEEHGGFNHDDTNVLLLVANPAITAHTIYEGVSTNQVAPTILQALGLDPWSLDGVRLEGTTPLPY